MNHVIVAAGGKATRFGGPISKQLYLLNGKPMVSWSLEVFGKEDRIENIVLVYPEDSSEKEYRDIARQFQKVRLVKGGATRYDSVRNGFESLQADLDDLVLIHDAARPLLSSALLRQILEAAAEKDCVIPALALRETIKEVEQGHILRTLQREKLYVAQTPQAFRYRVLRSAYDRVKPLANLTDEALLVEEAGFEVSIVPGEIRNIKITEPSDLDLGKYYLEKS